MLGPLDKSVVHPLPNILLLFIKHLIDALPSEIYGSGFLIESLNDVGVLIGPLVSVGGDSSEEFSLVVLVYGLHLDIVVLDYK